MKLRIGQALDLIDIVSGGQFAAGLPGKITDFIDILDRLFAEIQIQRLTILIAGKRRMILEIYPRPDLDQIFTEGYQLTDLIDLIALGIVITQPGIRVAVSGCSIYGRFR